MRTKTPFRRKRLISRGSSSSTSVEVKVERELQCSRCKAIFPDYLARCPECGSEEWIGLVEVNPYTRMPMETFLKACGHLLWLVGTIGFLVLLWQTDSPDAETNKLFIYGAFLLLFCSVLFSAAYFGMSEIMRRILRMQRRLRAFGCGQAAGRRDRHADLHDPRGRAEDADDRHGRRRTLLVQGPRPRRLRRHR